LFDLKNDDEALMLLSAIGMNWADWPAISKLGGARVILNSPHVERLISANQALAKPLDNLRSKLDSFYERAGFLLSPQSWSGSRLARVSKAPLVFWGRGQAHILKNLPMVAIVGSRKADNDGLKESFKLAQVLASHGISIVSGGALGVDSAAHQGSLAGGTYTVVVSGLACSWVHDERPAHIAGLASDRHCVLYPYGPTTPQGKFMFVERNRYVVALADAVVIVQGQEGSGTVHSARFAKSHNIPLFAIPGSRNNPLSLVPNQLIAAQQASAVVDFEQFARLLMTKTAKPHKKQAKNPVELPPILQLIKEHKALTMGEISILSGQSLLALQQEMLEYEMEGLVLKQGPQFVLPAN